MLIEFHMLKNYPATNLNRDDTGAPKTCFFGGAQRGRISSQCLKRTWRTSELFQSIGSSGIRSRNLPECVAEKLEEKGVNSAYIDHAKNILTGIANKDGKTNDKANITTQIIFFSPADVDAITDAVMQMINESGSEKEFKKMKPGDVVDKVKRAQARAITLDIALFGRMVTSDIFLDVEAAMQVAHAVSTHPVNLESDYFTAVDDLIQMSDDDSGAGMIGDIDYNSCCYYEYAALDTDKLAENLKDSPDAMEKADCLIAALLRVMAQSNPSGKQNTFAGHVLPEAVMVEFKQKKVPLSYVNAFAEPVSRFSRQVAQDSIQKLAGEVNLMDTYYGLQVEHRAWMAPRGKEAPARCEQFESFHQLLEACAAWAKE